MKIMKFYWKLGDADEDDEFGYDDSDDSAAYSETDLSDDLFGASDEDL